MTGKKIIKTDKAPQAIGPYSIGVKMNNFLFTSGQLGIDKNTGDLVQGGIEAETRQALVNLKVILEASGSSMENVIKTTVFLRDINEFGRMNNVYREFFTEEFPARSAIQVAALPKNGAVEIEAVAYIDSP